MFRSIAATLLISLALSTGTNASAQTDMATAETLMRGSGIWKQLDAVGPQMQAAFKSALSRSNPSVRQAELDLVAGIAGDAFAASRLRAVTQKVIAERTKPVYVAALLAWYRSPAGMALTRLEEHASSDERDPHVALQEDSALLASSPATRQAILKQLAQVTRVGEAMTTIMINTTVAAQLGLASALPDGPETSPADIRRSLEQQRPQMISAVNRLAVATYARIYASASNDDLAKYIGFLQSPAGTHFTDVGLQALDAALVDAAIELGRSIPASRDRSRT